MTPFETRTAILNGYRLVFTTAGGAKPGKSAPANIIADPKGNVHGVLYLLPLRKFARLDNSEGKQYTYLHTAVADQAGKRIPAVTFRVRDLNAAEGKPSRRYINLIRRAARERGLPPSYIEFLDNVEERQ